MDGDSNITVQQSHYLKTGSKPNLDLGSAVYLLGYTDKNELTVGEGKVVIATDNLIKVSPDGVTWSHGSAGFDHWEGSLDDLVNKPKLPIIRLMSTGQKSEHSCSSFTKRRVFKTSENENEISKPKDQPGSNSPPMVNSFQDETPPVNQRPGIPTPEIYESPKVTSGAFRRTENTQVQLLDINFPPRINKRTVPLQTNPIADAEIASPGSVNGVHSEVQSCASPIPQAQNEYISDGETTMYSAETAESRNFPSPKEGRFYQQQVGRSQSCVSYNRWGSGSVQRNPIAGRVTKGYSQGASSHRSNDFYSPTVSSIMKKQNNFEKQPNRPRSSATRSSPKWTF
ncbi:Trypsin-like cysteine/serine peptidase domain-containing protein [Artemisia annua]|uniref:Trypsin-like cysteine/serine peptidase domain-containing protein n=1 Tax=Artemisia annua TaxID=35608 RepID=A0A2U1MVP5_ARTAN|nr:Trypsin-like cysteine/serine peptidase domain-containing protein [Artemisia annua]